MGERENEIFAVPKIEIQTETKYLYTLFFDPNQSMYEDFEEKAL